MTTQAQSLELVTASAGLDMATSASLTRAFTPLFEKAQEWKARVDALNVTDVSQTRELKLARESRLALKDIRCESKRKHDELKADSLRRGKAIDGMHNIILYLVEPLEKRLLDMEQFAERKEQARLDERLVERLCALTYYGYNGLSDTGLRDLGEEAFDQILEGAKLLAEAKQKEAERLAKEKLEREQAEAQERERVRLENERLKAEAAAREEQMRKEREAAKAAADKAEAERKAALAKAEAEKKAALEAAQKKAREEQAARDEAARVEREKAKAEQERLAKKAREEKAAREKAERELAEQKRREEVARAEAAAKAKAEKDAAEEVRRKAEVAPDKIKLETYLLEIITADVPVMATAAGTAALTAILADLRKFEIEAKKNISKL